MVRPGEGGEAFNWTRKLMQETEGNKNGKAVEIALWRENGYTINS